MLLISLQVVSWTANSTLKTLLKLGTNLSVLSWLPRHALTVSDKLLDLSFLTRKADSCILEAQISGALSVIRNLLTVLILLLGSGLIPRSRDRGYGSAESLLHLHVVDVHEHQIVVTWIHKVVSRVEVHALHRLTLLFGRLELLAVVIDPVDGRMLSDGADLVLLSHILKRHALTAAEIVFLGQFIKTAAAWRLLLKGLAIRTSGSALGSVRKELVCRVFWFDPILDTIRSGVL